MRMLRLGTRSSVSRCNPNPQSRLTARLACNTLSFSSSICMHRPYPACVHALLEANIDCVHAYVNPAWGLQEPERAVAMYQEALQLGAPSAALFTRLARTFAAMHHYKKALAEYAKAVRLQPSDTALRLEKVDMFLRMRDSERAGGDLDACANLLSVPPLLSCPDLHICLDV